MHDCQASQRMVDAHHLRLCHAEDAGDLHEQLKELEILASLQHHLQPHWVAHRDQLQLELSQCKQTEPLHIQAGPEPAVVQISIPIVVPAPAPVTMPAPAQRHHSALQSELSVPVVASVSRVTKGPSEALPLAARPCNEAQGVAFSAHSCGALQQAKRSVENIGAEGCSQGTETALEKDLQCSICLELLIEPVSTHCGHSFCKGCYLQATDSKQPRCPYCRTAQPVNHVPKVNVALWSTIQQSCAPQLKRRRLALSVHQPQHDETVTAMEAKRLLQRERSELRNAMKYWLPKLSETIPNYHELLEIELARPANELSAANAQSVLCVSDAKRDPMGGSITVALYTTASSKAVGVGTTSL
eukprot:CAMPEP_0119319780 /NCGR_PEP_ID=MMETSP1333-20130426/50340_1 /TAXON_ID=418940 /ORGANISM="Scyphosphaera apsteinii, Strain RCC1455" /LENGTH=357 /DNA_ID=CAMNT_0007326275 /DNA_START=149 /DNA_END=1223 /DNA_ORIENTATION=+